MKMFLDGTGFKRQISLVEKSKRFFTFYALFLVSIAIVFSCARDDMKGERGDIKGEMEGYPENWVVIPRGATASEIQKILDNLKEGQVVYFPEGTWKLNHTLRIFANSVTIKGAGMDKTILDFSEQRKMSPKHEEKMSPKHSEEEEHGIFASGSNLVFEDFTVKDTVGDGLRIEGCENVVIRRVKAIWSCEECTDNGEYGIYPVKCRMVLIEESESKGASDAGIYVGQTTDTVVRNCKAYGNVAGIEIENTHNAVVYGNVAEGNTGGILVFSLPGLSVPDTRNVRVYKNTVRNNNVKNFAREGAIVSLVPSGLGMLVMAAQNVEVFENTIEGNNTIHIAVVSYYLTGREIPEGVKYFPLPQTIYIHQNTFSGGLKSPDQDNEVSRNLWFFFRLNGLERMPDIFFDGVVPEFPTSITKNPLRICHENNTRKGDELIFATLHWDAQYQKPLTALVNPSAFECKP